ncbi:isochorismatase [Rhizodiscina lignyota]|uniref:Isochorismatase n=1 Tax=Rhizodiscina lignyota TaxID=1504668 RepID=A0A9P4M8A8_9PEZI|nr:isochorismatase [Rhizodiscina lignyota]
MTATSSEVVAEAQRSHRSVQVSNTEPYHWPCEGDFNSRTTALVLVDMQRDFCCEGGYLDHQGYDISATRAIIPKLRSLLTAFRKAGYQVYHTREGHRADLASLSKREKWRSRNNPSGIGIGDEGPLGRLLIRGENGHDTIAEFYPIEGEPVIDKPGKGAFTYTDFDLLLRNRGIKNLVFGGVTTDVCVSTIMREANDRGYDCLILEDGCAAAEKSVHDATIQGVKMEGGVFGAVGFVEDVKNAVA